MRANTLPSAQPEISLFSQMSGLAVKSPAPRMLRIPSARSAQSDRCQGALNRRLKSSQHDAMEPRAPCLTY